MNDTRLRSNLVRLAHSNPQLRSSLLPLLKEAASSRTAGEGPGYYTLYWAAQRGPEVVLLPPSSLSQIVSYLKKLDAVSAKVMNTSTPDPKALALLKKMTDGKIGQNDVGTLYVIVDDWAWQWVGGSWEKDHPIR
jgi:hypothetical protein